MKVCSEVPNSCWETIANGRVGGVGDYRDCFCPSGKVASSGPHNVMCHPAARHALHVEVSRRWLYKESARAARTCGSIDRSRDHHDDAAAGGPAGRPGASMASPPHRLPAPRRHHFTRASARLKGPRFLVCRRTGAGATCFGAGS